MYIYRLLVSALFLCGSMFNTKLKMVWVRWKEDLKNSQWLLKVVKEHNFSRIRLFNFVNSSTNKLTQNVIKRYSPVFANLPVLGPGTSAQNPRFWNISILRKGVGHVRYFLSYMKEEKGEMNYSIYIVYICYGTLQIVYYDLLSNIV